MGQHLLRIAEDRKDSRIKKILDKSFKDLSETKKENLKAAIIAETSDVLDTVPKSAEFAYSENVSKIINKIGPDGHVSFGDLIDILHFPPVHYDSDCPQDCSIQIQCQRAKEVLWLVCLITKKLGHLFPIFSTCQSHMIGSIRDDAKIGDLDEMDINLYIETVNNFLTFDTEMQAVIINPDYENEWNDELFPHFLAYKTDNNVFDTNKYYCDFLSGVYAAISTLTTMDPLSTMDRLTTSFNPCLRCMSTDKEDPECIRCKHEPTCQSHDDHCGCQVFTNPSLARNKIGAVLHLSFTNSDGSKHLMDVDICCPVLDTCTLYDGNITARQKYFTTYKPIGWAEEYGKLIDMSAIKLQSRTVMFRHISRGIVSPMQVCIMRSIFTIPKKTNLQIRRFNRDGTIYGLQKHVLVLLKVLKLCTGSAVTSYYLKYLVHEALQEEMLRYLYYAKIGTGEAIRMVIEHKTIRNKFGSVHAELKKIGITGINVTDTGFLFIGLKKRLVLSI